jgi:hypothetical protein
VLGCEHQYSRLDPRPKHDAFDQRHVNFAQFTDIKFIEVKGGYGGK